MKLITGSLLLAISILAGTPALAATATLSSALGDSSPVFDHPFDDTSALTRYAIFEILVDTDGYYEFLTFYAGDVEQAEHLNGYLAIYEGTFDPLSTSSVVGYSNDYDYLVDGALNLIDEPRCSGANCSAFQAALTAGTTYTILVGAFSDLAGPSGQPFGEFTLTGSGPGIYPFPLPAAVWFMLSGLGVLLGLGRHR